MIVCPRCSKENQDHYKFCLGCGSELPREVAPRSMSVRTPPSALPAVDIPVVPSGGAALEKGLQFAATQQGSLSNPPPARSIQGPSGMGGGGGSLSAAGGFSSGGGMSPAAAMSPAVAYQPQPHSQSRPQPAPIPASSAGPNNCPSCGNPVPIDFKFCGTCGHRMTPGGGAAAAAPAPVAVAAVSSRTSRGSLVVINPDGSEGDTFGLSDGDTGVGRNAGAVFSADAYLSPLHATFSITGTSCTVRDENSLNGVYVKLKRDAPIKLQDSDVFRIGQEILRFESIPLPQLVQGVEPMGSPNPGYVGRLTLVIGRESTGNGYPIPPDGMHLGRERGDVVFPEDGYVSGLHCRVHYDGSSCVLTDVGSSNGTFLRVRGSRTLVTGDLLLMGQQLFRFQF